MTTAVAQIEKAGALDAVHRLFESAAFGESERQRDLLRYLVSEEIEGRGEQIKAFSVAVDVFGRSADFDPQTDSIVRVETGRLRKSLALYYATVGRDDPVEITIPKGGYRPTISRRGAVSNAGGEKGRGAWLIVAGLVAIVAIAIGAAYWLRTPVFFPARASLLIGVYKPEIAALDNSQNFIAAGLRKEFVTMLSHSPELSVVPLDAEPQPGDRRKFDFLVRSSAQISGQQALVQLLLLDGDTQKSVMDERVKVSLDIDDLEALQTKLAERLALSLGRPFGMIARKAMDNASSQSVDEIGCYFLALRYFDQYLPGDRATALNCLSKEAKVHALAPHSVAALAYLQLLNTRYGADARSWPVALAAFDKASADAFALDPDHWLVRSARFTSAICNGQVANFKSIALSAVEQMPNNAALLADVGTKLALGADETAEGLALMDRAASVNPEPQPRFVLPRAVQAINDGKPADALALLGESKVDLFPEGALLALIAAEQAGDAAQEAQSADRLRRAGLAGRANAVNLLQRSCWSKGTIARLAPLLDKAAIK